MIIVRGRELIIPESERQIGTQYDSNSEVRQIKVSRLTAGGVDISHLDFRLDLRYGNEKKDTALLDKEISDEDIILTWTVGPNSVKEVGTVWIAVRGSDDFGKVKWATNQGYLYVGKTIDTPSGEGVDLTEMEELEKRLDQKTAELDTAEKKRVEAENIREENEQQRLNNEREWQIQGEKAVQAAKDAQAAASAAEKEKTVAMEYATAAGGSADDARQYAESASTSAVNADASAKRAEEIAEGLGSYDGTAASVTAVDTHNFTGTGAGKKSTVQALLDKIAQKLIEKVVTSDTFQTVLAKYLVNNGLTTEAGKFGLDAAFGKNLQDQITEQNSNLATAIYSTDLMSAYDNPTFVRWDENTANTPYKAGLTMNQVGFAFCHGRYSGWQTIVAFSEGSKETFFHYCISGVPSNWLTIFSISKNTLADALHTGNNAGIYKVDSSTLNNPSITYGTEIILKDASSQWIFTIIIPTNLSAIYFDFYNGYGGSPGWTGWRKCDLVGVS